MLEEHYNKIKDVLVGIDLETINADTLAHELMLKFINGHYYRNVHYTHEEFKSVIQEIMDDNSAN